MFFGFFLCELKFNLFCSQLLHELWAVSRYNPGYFFVAGLLAGAKLLGRVVSGMTWLMAERLAGTVSGRQGMYA